MKFRVFLALALMWVFLPLAQRASAAVLKVVPESKNFSIGQEFVVDLRVDSRGESINAAQATVTFPQNIVRIVEIQKTGSIFNFWLEEPLISNEEGKASFIGGTQKGVSGAALQIIKIRFKTVGSGEAKISATEAAVASNDGSGTNVLSVVEDATIGVGTKIVTAEPGATADGGEEPQRVTRAATTAKGSPIKPVVRVPAYPDEDKWYNVIGEVVVFWDLPDDVTEIYSRLSQSQDKKPGTKDAELFTGRKLGVPSAEGVWYARVQFKNNVGLGEARYYKVAIDTTAPQSFESSIDSVASDDPSPTIGFATTDGLSGVGEYRVIIDGGTPIVSTSTALKVPPQRPGKHTVVVRAYDLAGNFIEDDLEFEVIPLPIPEIQFVTPSPSQGESVFISGKGSPGVLINVAISDRSNREVFRGVAKTNEGGSWDISVDQPLVVGGYTVTADARDERGAISLGGDTRKFSVQPKVVVSLWFVELGWFEIVLIVFLVLFTIWGFLAWRYVDRKKTREAYGVMAGRDIDKLCDILEKDINELKAFSSAEKNIDPHSKSEIDYFLNKAAADLAKMKKYLPKELRNIE